MNHNRNNPRTGKCFALAWAMTVWTGTQAIADGDVPTVIQQPQSQTLIASENAQFSVTASGTQPLAYQWRFNGADLTGENGTNYLVNNSQDVHAGNYTVVVTNTQGAVTSAVAVLTVEYPRVLANPPGAWLSVAEGGVGGTVNFSIAPLPHAPQAYQWRFNGTDIQSATGSNLVLNIQSPTNAGEFSVWVQTATGGVAGPPTRLEVFTVKAAREQWRTNAVTLGSNLKMIGDDGGNLYVAVNGVAGGANLVKLDKAGHVLWTSPFGGEVSDLARDSEGSIFAVGWTGSGSAYLTVKYNAAGSNCWSAGYSGGPPYWSNMARGVAVDDAGNVYVTGGSTGTNTTYPYDIATVKYASDGNQVWLRRYDSGGHDSGYGVALDSQTNVIVTGESLTIKYDRDGNRLWLAEGSGHKVVVDPDDNIFVADLARDSSGNGNGPLHLLMLSKTNGQLLASESLGNTVLLNLAADSQGNVVVIGTSYGGAWGFVVHRRGTGGANEWNESYPGLGYAGTVDKAGNVYVTGSVGGNCRIVKWNSEGGRAWVLDPPGLLAGLAVCVDKEFNVSVANNSGTIINYEQKHLLHPLGFQLDGSLRLTLTGEPRIPVWLQASTNLLDWQNLAPLQFSVGTADFTDLEAGTLPRRFFRTVGAVPTSP